MRFWNYIKSRSRQELAMVGVILLILVMIATRWNFTSRTAAEAFRKRFIPPTELTEADSLSSCDSLRCCDTLK